MGWKEGRTQPGPGKHRKDPQEYCQGGRRAGPSLVQFSDREGGSGVFTRAGPRMVHVGIEMGFRLFVGVLHKGASSLVQSSECDAVLGVFPGGTDQG